MSKQRASQAHLDLLIRIRLAKAGGQREKRPAEAGQKCLLMQARDVGYLL